MGGSTALAVLALQLVTALDGPILGRRAPHDDRALPARPSAPAEAGSALSRSWLVLRHSEREPAIDGVGRLPTAPQ